MYKTVTLTLIGYGGLVMHSGQLADPLNRFSRAIKAAAGRRTKTEADHEEVARLEFLGSLYLGADGAPCLPGEMLEACLQQGARKTKQGKQAAAGVIVEHNAPLIYDGPRTADGLWADERFRLRTPVKVAQARVMRTRPIFRAWRAVAEVEFNATLVDQRSVIEWARAAGQQIGLGDWRPKFGRFAVEAK